MLDLLKISHLPAAMGFNTKCFPVSRQWTLHTINIAKHRWLKCTRRQQEMEPWLWPIGLILLLYTQFGKDTKVANNSNKNMFRIWKNTSAKYMIMNLLLFLKAFICRVPNPSTKNDQKPARVDLLGNCYYTHIRRKKQSPFLNPAYFPPKWMLYVSAAEFSAGCVFLVYKKHVFLSTNKHRDRVTVFRKRCITSKFFRGVSVW